MRKLKNIILTFLMLFAFSFAFEDSKIELAPKRKEPAKLTIGVHKLKSKPLSMDFDRGKKIIYGEIELEDNQVVYVSETLDEIPSLTTANGRRVVNNIKKYLTKDIKVTPKFTYQIVKGNNENGIEEGKKYLVINCKAPLENVYIYVVEKDSYHIKEVYKGQFNILKTLQERESYGTIHIGKSRPVYLSGRTIKYNSYFNDIVLSKSEGQASSNTTYGEMIGGGYPKKYIPNDMMDNYYNPTLNKYPAIKIKLDGREVGSQRFEKEAEIKNFEQGIFVIDEIRADTTTESIAGTLKIFTTTENDNRYNQHIKINLNNWNEFGNINSTITLQYGTMDKDGNDWQVLREDSFGLKIDAVKDGMGEATEGALVFNKEHKIQNSGGGTITFGESSAHFSGPSEGMKFSGKAPKKLVGLEPMGDGPTKVRVYTGSGDKKEIWYEGMIGTDGIFDSGERTLYAKKIIYENGTPTSIEKVAGKIRIYTQSSDEYVRVTLTEWNRFAGDVSESIKIEYTDVDGNNLTVPIKTDILDFGVLMPEENIPEETEGQLYIYNIGLINQAQILLSDDDLHTIWDNDGFDTKKQTIAIGNFPKKIQVDENGADWGSDPNKWLLCIIDEATGHSDTVRVYRDGTTDQTEKFRLQDSLLNKNYFDLYFVAERGKEYFTLKIDAPFDNNDKINEFDKTYKFVYFSGKNNDNLTNENIIKTDILRIRYEKNNELNTAREIKIENPMVWYDYSTSRAISNIAHDKRVHLSESSPITRSRNGGVFSKNTMLDGRDWIEGSVPDYNYKVGRHKVTFFGGKGESAKYTKADGGTNSSTFINMDGGFANSGTTSFDKQKGSTVMFSYDGGNQYLNFGVAKYEFSETEKSTEVTILHGLPEKSENPNAASMKLRVTLPAFDGVEYVSPSYDIQPRKDYVKAYKFDDAIGTNPVTIDYGTVGFRDLDIRITTQSGGEGIELRAYEEVDLISETGNYTIKGAKLRFRDGNTERADEKSNRTYFKGENEKSTFKNLELWIPTQEQLIPQSRFQIVKKDTVDESPLEVGVSVTGGKEFYKPVADLYLDLTDKRYLATEITFENPSITTENSGSAEDWVYLNKTNYSGGKLIGREDTAIWGSVSGDIIDIPVNREELKEENVILEVFKADGTILTENLSKIDRGRLEFGLEDGTERKFLLKYVDKEDFIRFSLSDGYDENNLPRDIEFYIRYYAVEESKESKQFLFDQKYTVKFAKKVDYLGDTTIVFKNPMLVTGGNDGVEDYPLQDDDWGYAYDNNKFGRVRLQGQGEPVTENDHSRLEYDRISWWEVRNPVTYPGNNDAPYSSSKFEKRTVTAGHIGGTNIDMRKFISFDTTATTRVLKVGIPNNISVSVNGLKTVYELNFNGKRYRLKMEIEPFDPTYYGRVYPAIEPVTKNDEYQEISNVGSAIEDIFNPRIENGYIYIDLGTKYRDYLRYESVYAKGNEMKVVVGNNFSQGQEVDIIPTDIKEDVSALPIKGRLVFEKVEGGGRDENQKIVKLFSSDSVINEEPIEYRLKVKVSEEEYSKLQPSTKYELFISGNKNILHIGTSAKLSELKLNEPLNFTTRESGIEIKSEILDFGEIGLNLANTQSIISSSATAKVTVTSQYISTDRIKITPESDKAELFYNVVEGQEIDKTRWLNVRDINLEKAGVKAKSTREQEEVYNLTGTVDINNDESTKLGTYTGEVILNVTLNPPTE